MGEVTLYEHTRFGSTYEGLKLEIEHNRRSPHPSFGSTYEGLKRPTPPYLYEVAEEFWQYL